MKPQEFNQDCYNVYGNDGMYGFAEETGLPLWAILEDMKMSVMSKSNLPSNYNRFIDFLCNPILQTDDNAFKKICYQLYLRGLSCAQISNETGYTNSYVYRTIKDMNVYYEIKNERKKFLYRHIRRLDAQEVPIDTICELTGLSKFVVSTYITKPLSSILSTGLSKNSRVEYIKALHASGNTYNEIARKVGLSKSKVGTIIKGIQAASIALPEASKAREEVSASPLNISPINRDEHIIQLHKDGKSYRQIASIIGLSRSRIGAILRTSQLTMNEATPDVITNIAPVINVEPNRAIREFITRTSADSLKPREDIVCKLYEEGKTYSEIQRISKFPKSTVSGILTKLFKSGRLIKRSSILNQSVAV